VAPRRPKAGWSLVVTPLGGGEGAAPYVAPPGGGRRELTADEALVVERKTPRPRRKVL
jgi:hypothetical protein